MLMSTQYEYTEQSLNDKLSTSSNINLVGLYICSQNVISLHVIVYHKLIHRRVQV